MESDLAGIFDIDVVVADGAGRKAVYALLFQKVKFLLPVLVHPQDTDSASRIQPGDLIGSEHTRIQDDLSACPVSGYAEIFSLVISYFKGIYFHFSSFFLYLIFGWIQEIRIYLSWYGISFYKRYFESCNEV